MTMQNSVYKNMIYSFILITTLFVFSGCGVELLTTTAIQGELQAQQLKSMQRQVQGIANQTGKINLERAVQTFQAENGRYPKSLDELVPKYLPSLPQPSGDSVYSFDPATGQIITVSGGVDVSDLRRLEQIKFAVLQYAYTTGYYPSTLDTLYPTYLSFEPKTTHGEPFIYNPQTGMVMHPKQTAKSGSTTAGGGVPVSPPLAPVTGGIAIQQQLNGMTNSSGAVGSYSRQSVQNIQNDYSNKQNKTMDDLGL